MTIPASMQPVMLLRRVLTTLAFCVLMALVLAACQSPETGSASGDSEDAADKDDGQLALTGDDEDDEQSDEPVDDETTPEETPEAPTGPNSPGGTPLDQQALQTEIQTGILDQTGFQVTVICPADVVAVTGDTFDCQFTTDSDEGGTVLVTATDDEGNVSWQTESSNLAMEASSASVFELEIGNCLVNETEGEVSSVDIVDCSAPHDAEVFALFDVAEGPDEPYPGDDSFADETARCTDEFFEPYVGISYAESVIFVTTFRPTQGSWDQGDREVVCMLVGEDGAELTGSQQGAGI